MSLLDSILSSQNGSAVRELGSQFGLGDDQTAAALGALVPALAAGVHQNAQSPDGLSGLMAALAGGHHQQYVDDPSILGQASSVADGNAILGHVFGSRDVSRQVAAQASGQTGISQDVLKRMLPMVAALVMGAMARHTQGAGSGPSSPGSMAGGMPGMGGASLAPGGLGGGDLMSMIVSTLGQAGATGVGGPPSGGGGLGDLLGRMFGR